MQKEPIYLKAITLRDMSDLSGIKEDARKHTILIIRVTPLAHKDIDNLRKVIEDLWFEHPANGGVWHTRREPTQATVSPESEAA